MSALLGAAARVARSLPKTLYLPTAGVRGGDFAPDGYHPGPRGYAVWGRALAEAVAGLLEKDGRPRPPA